MSSRVSDRSHFFTRRNRALNLLCRSLKLFLSCTKSRSMSLKRSIYFNADAELQIYPKIKTVSWCQFPASCNIIYAMLSKNCWLTVPLMLFCRFIFNFTIPCIEEKLLFTELQEIEKVMSFRFPQMITGLVQRYAFLVQSVRTRNASRGALFIIRYGPW